MLFWRREWGLILTENISMFNHIYEKFGLAEKM
jgi:hypothetical protein